MVDIADLADVGALYEELRTVRAVLDNFAQGGRIVAMTVSASPPAQGQPPGSMPLTVNTDQIDYPPQMVDAIRSALTTREQEIRSKLSALGVTEQAR